MIIATRILRIANGLPVLIRLHAPEKSGQDWISRFDIDWPGQAISRWGSGVDAVQALIQALQMIGAEVNTSSFSEAGDLAWLPGYHGLGFPVPNNVRHLLNEDDDKQL